MGTLYCLFSGFLRRFSDFNRNSAPAATCPRRTRREFLPKLLSRQRATRGIGHPVALSVHLLPRSNVSRHLASIHYTRDSIGVLPFYSAHINVLRTILPAKHCAGLPYLWEGNRAAALNAVYVPLATNLQTGVMDNIMEEMQTFL